MKKTKIKKIKKKGLFTDYQIVWEALIKTLELFIICFFHELDYGYTSLPSSFKNQCQATGPMKSTSWISSICWLPIAEE